MLGMAALMCAHTPQICYSNEAQPLCVGVCAARPQLRSGGSCVPVMCRWMNTRVAKYMDNKANTGMFDSDGDAKSD